jgi:hypothetical protein
VFSGLIVCRVQVAGRLVVQVACLWLLLLPFEFGWVYGLVQFLELHVFMICEHWVLCLVHYLGYVWYRRSIITLNFRDMLDNQV